MAIIQQELAFAQEEYRRIIDIINLGGGKSRVVGGAVRDAILDQKIKDIDIATNIVPSEIMQIMADNGIKCIPTGIEHGTVSAILNGKSYEITTLRADISTDGRRATVRFSQDFAEDAARRDFTINALSYCPVKKEIYDYFSGYEDIANKIVRFIGEPSARIREDYLRILRFFRFTARFGWQYDQPGLDACTELAEGVRGLSQERIKQELDQLLMNRGIIQAIELMAKIGVLQYATKIEGLTGKLLQIAQETSKLAKLGLMSRYALTYGSIGQDIAKSKLLAMRHSRQECSKLYHLLKLSQNCAAGRFAPVKHELMRIWLASENDYSQQYHCCYISALGFAEDESIITKLAELNYFLASIKTKPKLPIASGDLIKLGYSGKDLGLALKKLEQAWLDSGFAMPKSALLAML